MLVPKLAGTIGSTLRPSLDQIPERRLCTRRRRSSNSGVPSPADQAVFAHVMDEGRHIAVPVRTTHDQRLMRTHSVRLRRTIARRMAIHATRVLQHLTGFLKQRDRTRALVLDRLEARNRAELCAFLSRALAECGGEANRNHRRCDGKQQREPWTHHATPCTIGRRRGRCKPSRASAFATAGPIGGTPGSPTPVGCSLDFTMATS